MWPRPQGSHSPQGLLLLQAGAHSPVIGYTLINESGFAMARKQGTGVWGLP